MVPRSQRPGGGQVGAEGTAGSLTVSEGMERHFPEKSLRKGAVVLRGGLSLAFQPGD